MKKHIYLNAYVATVILSVCTFNVNILDAVNIFSYFRIFPHYGKFGTLLLAFKTYFHVTNRGLAATTNLFYY